MSPEHLRIPSETSFTLLPKSTHNIPLLRVGLPAIGDLTTESTTSPSLLVDSPRSTRISGDDRYELFVDTWCMIIRHLYIYTPLPTHNGLRDMDTTTT